MPRFFSASFHRSEGGCFDASNRLRSGRVNTTGCRRKLFGFERRRRVLLWLAIVVVLMVVFGSWVVFTAREPKWEGKSLSQWLEDLGSTNDSVRFKADQSLRAIGGDAVPQLVRWVRTGSAQRVYERVMMSLPVPVRRLFPHINLRAFQIASMRALAVIGPEGAGAIPVLSEQLFDDDREIVSAASAALARMGPAAIDRLAHALTNRDVRHPYSVVTALQSTGTNTLSVLPSLRMALLQGDSVVKHTVIAILSDLGEPGVTILAEGLARPSGPFKKEMLEAVAAVGTNAAAAIPSVRALAEDDEYPWQRTAKGTLRAIEPRMQN